jgi:MFS superfamily sulfate permease-like transporter
MISEVARSSANIGFGARTRWANFFHGFFLFIAMLLMIPVIELIPNTALAAMLIYVGYNLASPNEFIKTYKMGKAQLVIFLVTIAVTIATDLLVGIASGIIVKFIILFMNGATLKSLFKAHYKLTETDGKYNLMVQEPAIFSNLIGFKRIFKTFQSGKEVTIDFSNAKLVDHTFMEFLENFEAEYHHSGGKVIINGFEHFELFSDHPLSGRKIRK